MALKRNETYPGRFSNPTSDHPQGAFKNRSAPGAQDGSFCEQQWANDWDGFFGRLLTLAGITPSGNVDTAQASQYFDAIRKLTLQRGNPFGDIVEDGTVSTALANLGLTNFANALIKTNNLSDLPDKAVSRTNLGVPAGVDKQMCTAWASWSNNGTVCTIKDSFNVSSVTLTAVGQCQVNFSSPMSNANYSPIYTPDVSPDIVGGGTYYSPTTGSVGAACWGGTGSGTGISLTRKNATGNSIHIYGGK